MTVTPFKERKPNVTPPLRGGSESLHVMLHFLSKCPRTVIYIQHHRPEFWLFGGKQMMKFNA